MPRLLLPPVCFSPSLSLLSAGFWTLSKAVARMAKVVWWKEPSQALWVPGVEQGEDWVLYIGQRELQCPPQGQGDGDVPMHLAASPACAPSASRGYFLSERADVG